MLSSLRIPIIYLVAGASFGLATGQFIGGWASRELGGCAFGEVTCGGRGPGFSACCPHGTVCRRLSYMPGITDKDTTTGCCPSGDDCSIELVTYQVCADDSWSVYNASGLPFCCQKGFKGGHGTSTAYDSCRSGAFPSTETALAAATAGVRPTGNLDSGSNKLSGGAIGGIAVGGVAALSTLMFLAWWLRRRAIIRKWHAQSPDFGNVDEIGGIDDKGSEEFHQEKKLPPVYSSMEIRSPPPAPVVQPPMKELPEFNTINELSGLKPIVELPGFKPVSELPESHPRPTNELPG
ncbi:hypothetical protein ABW21_db0208843 [Orbilia brochopaga]|nr:hypothetical protein ABW21_db0208843 [Drechslerella brochopaga]